MEKIEQKGKNEYNKKLAKAIKEGKRK